MKKVIFWILVCISIIIVLRIAVILINDFERLTEYGFGYLIGLIILFLVILSGAILIGLKIYRKRK